MSLTQGDPLPNITTTKKVETSGPDWYNTYLEDLAKPGTDLLKKTGAELVAPMSELQTGVLDYVKGDDGTGTGLRGYETMLQDAGDTAALAAAGMTPEMIQGFLNPYTTGVVNEMGRLSQQSMQKSLMPSLKGAFAGTGGMGGKRMYDAMGQMGADVQSNLLGAQTKEMASGYNSALKAAADQAGLYRNAAETQKGLATTELDLKLKELERLYNLGSEEQKLAQAEILAPLNVAKSAADVYSNVKVPSTVSETANAPIPGAYSTSPLATISGLASLFASGQGGTSAVNGILGTLFGKEFTDSGKSVMDWLNSQGGSSSGGTGGGQTQEEIDYSNSLGDFEG
jgi:hypothetical protein